jgi:GNAT superfamily N-acetyltransferase
MKIGIHSGGEAVEPWLLWDWLGGRSVARGSPLPVPDRGGMRVDTASPTELCRYVFAGPAPGIRELAASIRTPGTFIKMCGPGELLLSMAPAGWRLEPRGYLMTHDGAPAPSASLPPGYRIDVSRQGPAFAATIFSEDGTIAASGFAAEHGRAFVFDRIITHPAHRRRGLGKALMSALGARQRSANTTRVLVATEEGRALYSSIGWTVASVYSTIVLPDQDAGSAA